MGPNLQQASEKAPGLTRPPFNLLLPTPGLSISLPKVSGKGCGNQIGMKGCGIELGTKGVGKSSALRPRGFLRSPIGVSPGALSIKLSPGPVKASMSATLPSQEDAK